MLKKIIEMKIKNLIFMSFTFLTISINPCSAQTVDERISEFSQARQNWLNQSCPRSLGPSLWRNCMEREMYALKEDVKDSKTLSESDKQWLEQACSKSLGPSLYKSCVNREISAFESGMPNLNKLNEQNKQ